MPAMNLLLTSAGEARGAEYGFTLIELMVTLTVAGILLAIAVPAFNNFVLNDRDAGQVNSLIASLNYARSEAIKRGSPTGIKVCPSTDGATCNNGTDWATGWIVLDLNPAAPPPQVIQNIPAMGGANTLMAVGAARAGITFLSSGLATPAGNPALTVRICDTRGALFARDVEVNSTGRVAGSQTPGQSVGGAALVCP